MLQQQAEKLRHNRQRLAQGKLLSEWLASTSGETRSFSVHSTTQSVLLQGQVRFCQLLEQQAEACRHQMSALEQMCAAQSRTLFIQKERAARLHKLLYAADRHRLYRRLRADTDTAVMLGQGAARFRRTPQAGHLPHAQDYNRSCPDPAQPGCGDKDQPIT